MAIQKIVVSVTIMGEADSPEDFANRLSEMSLTQMDEETDCGDMIGSVSIGRGVTIPQDKVKRELEAFGNDGDFFNMLNGEGV